MKLLVLVGLFSVVCFGQPIVSRWCETPCNSQVVTTCEYRSFSAKVAAPILESGLGLGLKPRIDPQDGRPMENRWKPLVSRSAIVPIVIVRSIAEYGDDLTEALLQLWRESPRVAWCLLYLADIFTAVVLPMLAMFAVYLLALKLASSLSKGASVARQRPGCPTYSESQSRDSCGTIWDLRC
jgi:hypothetical protein